VGSGVIPCCDVFSSGRRKHGSPCRGNLPGWHRVSISCSIRAGNSVRGCLWAGRILCSSFARRRLQPRGMAVFSNATQVATSLLPARPLVARGVRSRDHGFLGSGSRGRLCSQINGKGRPTKKAPHDRVNQSRGGQVMIKGIKAGGLPGYGGSSPFDHLLRLRAAQVLRCQLWSPTLLSRLAWSRLSPSLGASRPASSLLMDCRL
jgi:hypothetical protein